MSWLKDALLGGGKVAGKGARGLFDDFLTTSGVDHLKSATSKNWHGDSLVDMLMSPFDGIDQKKKHNPPSHNREEQAIKDFFKT